MKISPIEVEKQLVTPVENETQRVLRHALELLGPNGENWLCGASNPDRGNAYHLDGLSCAIGALQIAGKFCNGFEADRWLERNGNFLNKAAEEAGHHFATRLNDAATSFAPVRAMFLRAIELAGQ